MPEPRVLARLFVCIGLTVFVADLLCAQVVIRERVEVDAGMSGVDNETVGSEVHVSVGSSGPTPYRLRFHITDAVYARYDGSPVPFDGDIAFSGLRPDSTSFEARYPVADHVALADTMTLHNYGCSPGGYTWGFSNHGSLPTGSGLSHDKFGGWVDVGRVIGEVVLSGSFVHPEWEHTILGPNYTYAPYDLRISEQSRYLNYPYCHHEDDAQVDLRVAASAAPRVELTTSTEFRPIVQGDSPRRIRAYIFYPSPTSPRLAGVPANILLGEEGARLGSLSDADGNPITEPVTFDQLAGSSTPDVYYNPDGPKDAEVAFDPIADSLYVEAATDSVYVESPPGLLQVGSYQYSVTIGRDTLSYGEAASVTIVPVYGDGEAVPAPDDFLIDLVYANPGIELDPAQPAEGWASRDIDEGGETAERAGFGGLQRGADQHRPPTEPSEVSECYPTGEPFWNPLRFLVPDSLNGVPVTGIREGCGPYGWTALEDVPYGLARSGLLELVADQVIPPSGKVLAIGVTGETNYDGVNLFLGADGSVIREAWLETASNPDTIAVGEASLLTGRLMDATGALDFDPERLFVIEAYSSADLDSVGVVVNERTGEFDPEYLEVTYGDLSSGLVRYVADPGFTPGPPTVQAEGSPQHRRRVRRPEDPARAERRAQARERALARRGPVPRVASSTLSQTGTQRLLDDALVEFDIYTGDFALYGYAALVVTASEPVVRLLRQNGDEVAEGYVMVSKVAPDQLFEPGDIGFEAPQGGASNPYVDYDPDTFRPEALGLLEDEQVAFRIEVLGWGGSPTGYNEVFEAVGEVQAGGTWSYRGKRQLRLVSNAEPPEAPVQARYDDDPFGFADENRQTIRVELEDKVRVTLLVDGQSIGDPQEWTVGQSAGEPGPDAVRRATLHWVVLDGNDDAVPEVITDRMSEDWAQASVYFRTTGLPGTLDVEAIRSVLSIRHEGEHTTTTGSGALAFDVVDEATGNVLTRVTESYGPNESIAGIVGRISLELYQQGFNSEVFPGRETLRGETLLALDPSRQLRVDGFLDSDEVKLDEFGAVMEDARIPDLRVTALHAKDDIDESIDVIAADTRRLGGDRAGVALSGEPSYGNTIFLIEQAADQSDLYPMVAGHEAGHILLQNPIPGGIPGNTGHHPDARNLMDPREGGYILEGGLRRDPYEAVDGSKRLTAEEHLHARCMSGMSSDRATLVCPLGSDPTGPVLLQALGQNQ